MNYTDKVYLELNARLAKELFNYPNHEWEYKPKGLIKGQKLTAGWWCPKCKHGFLGPRSVKTSSLRPAVCGKVFYWSGPGAPANHEVINKLMKEGFVVSVTGQQQSPDYQIWRCLVIKGMLTFTATASDRETAVCMAALATRAKQNSQSAP